MHLGIYAVVLFQRNYEIMILIMKWFSTFCCTHHICYCAFRALYRWRTRRMVTWVARKLVRQVIIQYVSVLEWWRFPSEVDGICVSFFVFNKVSCTLQFLYGNLFIRRYLREKTNNITLQKCCKNIIQNLTCYCSVTAKQVGAILARRLREIPYRLVEKFVNLWTCGQDGIPDWLDGYGYAAKNCLIKLFKF